MAAPIEVAYDAEVVLIFLKTLAVIHVFVTGVLYTLTCVGMLQKPSQVKTILLITAHPDDECMFFGPTLSQLTMASENLNRVHLLCLTNGDFYGKGRTREKEIIKSCRILGIAEARVTIVNDSSKLPDDPSVEWPPDHVQRHILDTAQQVKPEEVYTFDGHGVSGHKNHIAVHNAVREIFMDGTSLKGVKSVYFLESVSMFRKYLAIFDLPLALLCKSHVTVAAPGAMVQIQKAMLAHHSQLEWFRWLYIIFSRYMTINAFTKVEINKGRG